MNRNTKELIKKWYELSKSIHSLYDNLGTKEILKGINDNEYKSLLSLLENTIEIDNNYINKININYNNRGEIIKYLTVLDDSSEVSQVAIVRMTNKLDHYLIKNSNFDIQDILFNKRNQYLDWIENSYNELLYITLFRNIIADINKQLDNTELTSFEISAYTKLKYHYLYKIPNYEEFLIKNNGNTMNTITMMDNSVNYPWIDKSLLEEKSNADILLNAKNIICNLGDLSVYDINNEQMILAVIQLKEVLCGYLYSLNNEESIKLLISYYQETKNEGKEYKISRDIIEHCLVKSYKKINKSK